MSIVATCRVGQAHHSLGDYARAVDFLRRPLASLQGDLERQHFGMAGLPSVFARAWLGWSLAELGNFPEGIARCEEGIAVAEAADHAYSQILAAWGLGTLHVVRGDPERAIPVLERGLVVARMADIPLLFPFVAAPLGAAYSLAGRVGDALPLLEQAARQAASMNLQANHPLRLVWLGEALVGAGKLGQAAEQATQALALAESQGEQGSLAYARRLLGEIAARREPPDVQAGIEAYRSALSLASELSMQPLAARCRLGLAVLHQRSGAAAEARVEHDTASEALRAMEMTRWLGRLDTLDAGARAS
jgi:tetratricopeptide (TPR) repeat protein